MRRRDVLSLLGGAAASWPLAVAAQPAKVPLVGILVTGRPDPAEPVRFFRDRLRTLGYVEGKNIRIELRSAEGNIARLPELAAALVRDKPDVIVAWMTPVVLAAKRATAAIPIVMMGAGDPAGMGIVTSLARPGGNITGMAGQTAELAGKEVQLLKQMLPSLHRVAALCNAPDPFSKPFREAIERAGQAEGIEIVAVMLAATTELDAAFAAMPAKNIDAMIVQPSLPAKTVAALALGHRMPAVSPGAGFAKYGGLMAYIPAPKDYYGQAAVFVDKILKGAKPADLPVEQPTKFELTINLKTAKAIGVTVPAALLDQADEVIE